MKYSLFVALSLFLILGCGAGKKTAQIPEVTIEETNLDTLVIKAPKLETAVVEDYELPVYNPSYTLRNDLLHTKLDIRFDWPNQSVIGKANLTFQPVFYPVNTLELDAKNFDIKTITTPGSRTPLKYDYDNQILTIQLDRTYTPKEKYEIFIDYVANPTRGDKGGSQAITSDQGLFFVNHDNSNPDKPMQIWTQGETENNSRWFPTIDKPNERCTQEIYLTVQDKFKTLSNGDLISSNKNTDGTRTDYWKMDKAHAPYLFMLAVGDFAVVTEKWKGKLIEYYVEPEYKNDAKAIFAHTPEMLQFFSDLLDVEYPWSKYSQIVVRDFVSGAMENTTGVIFGDFVQKSTRELIDNGNDRIVAHELFHHWFGDLVTCESWANLTLNEGFANYSEYLWTEHKYGVDQAGQLLRGDIGGYIQSAGFSGVHPLIHYSHADKEDMFDAHSYNKGGAVLHMLRSYLGDDAFFAGLRKYLNDNAYSAVEVDELRMAFEDTVGEDLNWFFDQWYLSAGHPELDISYDYDPTGKKASVTIVQMQDPEVNPAIFTLPMGVDVFIGEQAPVHHDILINQRRQTFTFDAAQKPRLINVDTDKSLLGVKKDNKQESELIFQYYNGAKYLDRWEALDGLEGSKSPAAKKVFKAALDDKFWGLRRKAIGLIEDFEDPGTIGKIATLAEKDARSEVRAGALEIIGETGDIQYAPLLKKAIDTDPTYRGMSAALSALAGIDSDAAMSIAEKMQEEKNPAILTALTKVYGQVGDPKFLSFFEKNADKVDGFASFNYFDNYFQVLKEVTDENQMANSLKFLSQLGTDNGISGWKRFSATKALFDLSNNLTEKGNVDKASEVKDLVDAIVAQEKDPQLLGIYSRFK